MNDATVFDDVADNVLIAAKLVDEMLPPVNIMTDVSLETHKNLNILDITLY